jgi:MOSC domain-containing protein YiiM
MSQPAQVSHPAPTAQIVGAFVGTPAQIGEVRGRPVVSAIAKAPVAAAELALSRTNLDGDRQADLSVHGGPDKAVYVYPAVHYPAWQADGFAVEVGGFGENLTVAGLTEDDVRLGDAWRWGEALVEVSQPRAPCYKLSLHTGRKDVGPHMLATGRCGWYLRVLEQGVVPTGGRLVLERRDPEAPTLAETFAAMFDDERVATTDVVARVLASPALAAGWREPLLARRAARA